MVDESGVQETQPEERKLAPLFTVVPSQDGEGFVSRFNFEAIGAVHTGPVRATLEECVPDCLEAMKGLLGQLGISPENFSVMVVHTEKLT